MVHWRLQPTDEHDACTSVQVRCASVACMYVNGQVVYVWRVRVVWCVQKSEACVYAYEWVSG